MSTKKNKDSGLDVFIIHPVANVTNDELEFLYAYAAKLEAKGKTVHLPHRDTVQTDPHGIAILTTNRDKVCQAKEIHLFWKRKSIGSFFDFGMTFMALFYQPNKKIVLINRSKIKPTNRKSFENVLIQLHERKL